jgi:hypothetical protein
MNHDTSQGNNGDIDRLVQEWRVETPLPAGFKQAVWRRVAAQAGTPAISPVEALRDWLARQFARPAWSIGYAMLLLSAGLVTGYWQASAQTERWNQLMASRYVQSVDPYFQASLQP